MKHYLSFIFFSLIIIFSGCKDNHLYMGTGGTTGTYYAFGTATAKILSEKTEIPIYVQSSGASKANIQLLGMGRIDIAIVQNDIMDYAWRGVDLFSGEGNTSFSCIAALYPEVCHVVANPASGIECIEDLRGKKISVGDSGSGGEINARQILEIYGITFNDIHKFNYSFGASADALKENKIDAFFCVAGPPTPAIATLASEKEIAILEIDRAAELIRKYSFYSRHTLPAGSYEGQDGDIKTVTVKSALIAGSKVPVGTVYTLTKALFENKELIAAAHVKGNDLSPSYALEGISVPFHSGAIKYYKEIGVYK